MKVCVDPRFFMEAIQTQSRREYKEFGYMYKSKSLLRCMDNSNQTVWSQFEPLLDNPDALREFFMSLPNETITHALAVMVRCKLTLLKAQHVHKKKFKEENGVTSGWKSISGRPDALEKHREYNREYARKRREAAKKLQQM